MKFRFHSLALPHSLCHPDYSADAYQMKALKFARMMSARGHEVITYAVEGSRVPGSDIVSVVDTETFQRVYGDHDYRSKFFRYDLNDDVYQMFYTRAAREIRARLQPGDFILPWWGAGHRPVCDAVPEGITVEAGIGYARGHWARYKIFESYAIMHAWYGLEGVERCTMDNYATVIPNYFDPDDFDFNPTPEGEPYLLFIGRVYEGKGIHIAIQAAAATGYRLKVAGQGSLKDSGYHTTPDHVEEIGYADPDLRRSLMARATATIVASQYVEPFGGVQIESLMSGTPTITSDIGAFTENNLPGITGFRCRTFNDYVEGIKNIHQINRQHCRAWAVTNFSLERVAPQYEDYFKSVRDIHQGQGWYELRERSGPPANRRYYPRY